MIINEKITAITESFIKYSLLLNHDEFIALRTKIEPVALSNMEQYPQARAAYTLILDNVENAVKSMGGGTLKD